MLAPNYSGSDRGQTAEARRSIEGVSLRNKRRFQYPSLDFWQTRLHASGASLVRQMPRLIHVGHERV